MSFAAAAASTPPSLGDLVVIAFGTDPRSFHFGSGFCEIYFEDDQFFFPFLRTTAAAPPPWLLSPVSQQQTVETGCSPESFYDVIDEKDPGLVRPNSNNSRIGAPLAFTSALDGETYSFDWNVPGRGATLAVISAPPSIVAAWGKTRSDVRVIPGTQAHLLPGERMALLKHYIQTSAVPAPAGSFPLLPLSFFFPILIGDNVRQLKERVQQQEPQWKLADLLVEVIPPSAAAAAESGRAIMINDVVIGLALPPPPSSSEGAAAAPSTFMLRTARGQRCEFVEPVVVIAPVGHRESSTHVNAIVDPSVGLPATAFSSLALIAGDSPMVGPNSAATTSAHPNAERPQGFTLIGRLLLPTRQNPVAAAVPQALTLEFLAKKPHSSVTVPILALGGTSAELGKSTLTCKIISLLHSKGLRVAAIKSTGTGGSEDSLGHLAAGAVWIGDQVTAGMATTYCAPELFSARIMRTFAAACSEEASPPDCIVVEMGGDLIFGNNSELLKMPFMQQNLVSLLVIASDALSGYGAAKWLSERHPAIAPRARLVNSPFKNFEGARRRFTALGLTEPYDVNEPEKIVDLFLSELPKHRAQRGSF